MTDTLACTLGGREIFHETKFVPLPHLDAIVAAQGGTYFLRDLFAVALQVSAMVEDFDHFAFSMGEVIPQVYDGVIGAAKEAAAAAGGTYRGPNAIVFLLGHSRAAERFIGRAFASDFDFRMLELDDELYVMPTPLSSAPAPIEAHRLRAHFEANFGDSVPVEQLCGLARRDAPTSPTGWVELAKEVRRDRSLVHLYSGFKTYIGGTVMHTVLERGSVATRAVHRFDDEGEEFAHMMRYSFHPLGQTGPCSCESGQRAIDCCLVELIGQRCPCGSPSTFAECCRVDSA